MPPKPPSQADMDDLPDREGSGEITINGNGKLAKWAGNKLEDWGDQPDLLAFGPVIGIAYALGGVV